MDIRKAAQTISDQLVKNIGYCSDDKPLIHEDDEGHICVSWEGLSGWTMNDSYTMFEESGLGEMGFDYESKENPYYEVPKGYYAEPYNNVTLAIYKD